MIIGVPKEIKEGEYRAALTPAGAKTFIDKGHKVLVEDKAGRGSGFEYGRRLCCWGCGRGSGRIYSDCSTHELKNVQALPGFVNQYRNQ